MKFRFTIENKLMIGFGLVSFSVIVFGVFIIINLQKNIDRLSQNKNLYIPSSNYVDNYLEMVTNSKMLIKSWVYIEKNPDTPDKITLIELIDSEFPELENNIKKLSGNWNKNDIKLFNEINALVKDSIFKNDKIIMSSLSKLENYDDAALMFDIQISVEQGGELYEKTERAIEKLKLLQKNIKTQSEIFSLEMFESLLFFRLLIIFTVIFLLSISLVISIVTARKIVKPIKKLNNILTEIGKGELPEITLTDTGDELGEMNVSLNNVVKELRTIITEIKNTAIK